MRIARVFAVMVAAVCMVAILAPTVNAQALIGQAPDQTESGRVTVNYDQSTGMVKIYTDNTAGDGLTTIVAEFRPSGSPPTAPTDLRFDPSKIEWTKGLFDVATNLKMASINPDGVGRGMENAWTVGKVLPTGLTYNDLGDVLFISGSHSNGGGLAKHGLEPLMWAPVPEPSTLVLFGLGLLGLVGLRRRS